MQAELLWAILWFHVALAGVTHEVILSWWLVKKISKIASPQVQCLGVDGKQIYLFLLSVSLSRSHVLIPM